MCVRYGQFVAVRGAHGRVALVVYGIVAYLVSEPYAECGNGIEYVACFPVGEPVIVHFFPVGDVQLGRYVLFSFCTMPSC